MRTLYLYVGVFDDASRYQCRRGWTDVFVSAAVGHSFSWERTDVREAWEAAIPPHEAQRHRRVDCFPTRPIYARPRPPVYVWLGAASFGRSTLIPRLLTIGKRKSPARWLTPSVGRNWRRRAATPSTPGQQKSLQPTIRCCRLLASPQFPEVTWCAGPGPWWLPHPSY